MKNIQFKITNKEPIRIADCYRSKSGEIETIDYLTGSAIRGIVVNALKNDEDFETFVKKLILSDQVNFLNAYPCREGKELIPSLKGFYEDKSQNGELTNLLKNGEFEEGQKRASLGRFCMIENNEIYYTSVQLGESLNINAGNTQERDSKEVFRINFIKAGQKFLGRIVLNDEAENLAERIKTVLEKSSFRIGGSRSSGMGLCEISNVEVSNEQSLIYQNLSSSKQEKLKEVYMVLLSPLCMRNADGQPCGIDWERFPKLLGVHAFETEKILMSTSIVHISHNNRTWGMRTPELTMYEAGSVFRLVAKEGVFDPKKLQQIEQSGLGIGRNYGCGRILFCKDFEKINHKKELVQPVLFTKMKDVLNEDDIKKDLKQSAINLYRVQIEEGISRYLKENPQERNTARSQYGRISALYQGMKYRISDVQKEVETYLKHEEEKEKHSSVHSINKKDRSEVFDFVRKIFNTDFDKLLGLKAKNEKILGFDVEKLLDEEEEIRYRLQLLDNILRLANRRDKADE